MIYQIITDTRKLNQKPAAQNSHTVVSVRSYGIIRQSRAARLALASFLNTLFTPFNQSFLLWFAFPCVGVEHLPAQLWRCRRRGRARARPRNLTISSSYCSIAGTDASSPSTWSATTTRSPWCHSGAGSSSAATFATASLSEQRDQRRCGSWSGCESEMQAKNDAERSKPWEFLPQDWCYRWVLM